MNFRQVLAEARRKTGRFFRRCYSFLARSKVWSDEVNHLIPDINETVKAILAPPPKQAWELESDVDTYVVSLQYLAIKMEQAATSSEKTSIEKEIERRIEKLYNVVNKINDSLVKNEIEAGYCFRDALEDIYQSNTAVYQSFVLTLLLFSQEDNGRYYVFNNIPNVFQKSFGRLLILKKEERAQFQSIPIDLTNAAAEAVLHIKELARDLPELGLPENLSLRHALYALGWEFLPVKRYSPLVKNQKISAAAASAGGENFDSVVLQSAPTTTNLAAPSLTADPHQQLYALPFAFLNNMDHALEKILAGIQKDYVGDSVFETSCFGKPVSVFKWQHFFQDMNAFMQILQNFVKHYSKDHTIVDPLFLQLLTPISLKFEKIYTLLNSHGLMARLNADEKEIMDTYHNRFAAVVSLLVRNTLKHIIHSSDELRQKGVEYGLVEAMRWYHYLARVKVPLAASLILAAWNGIHTWLGHFLIPLAETTLSILDDFLGRENFLALVNAFNVRDYFTTLIRDLGQINSYVLSAGLVAAAIAIQVILNRMENARIKNRIWEISVEGKDACDEEIEDLLKDPEVSELRELLVRVSRELSSRVPSTGDIGNLPVPSDGLRQQSFNFSTNAHHQILRRRRRGRDALVEPVRNESMNEYSGIRPPSNPQGYQSINDDAPQSQKAKKASRQVIDIAAAAQTRGAIRSALISGVFDAGRRVEPVLNVDAADLAGFDSTSAGAATIDPSSGAPVARRREPPSGLDGLRHPVTAAASSFVTPAFTRRRLPEAEGSQSPAAAARVSSPILATPIPAPATLDEVAIELGTTPPESEAAGVLDVFSSPPASATPPASPRLSA